MNTKKPMPMRDKLNPEGYTVVATPRRRNAKGKTAARITETFSDLISK